MCRTFPFDSGAETSPGGDMETGLTPPQCSWPLGLIKKDSRANLSGGVVHSGNCV